nr:alpha-glucan family phosphorylase [Chloroflexota bacterium]
MRPMFLFNVVPSLPPALKALKELAYNLWWTWNPEAIELFRRLDREGWEASGHNPVRMLGMIDQDRLNSAASDDGFLAHLERVSSDFQHYLTASNTWYRKNHGPPPDPFIAYFCLEFGFTECLPIYSGGMGVLAGDYLKSASDLGLPLVAVGLLYQQGYFRQYLNADGWQGELYPDNDFYMMPVQLEKRNGVPVTIEVDYPGRRVSAQVWRVQVGRVALYLLDTNVPQNRAEDRRITHQLYGGDGEMRISQEIMLGIGGLKALQALGIKPRVCHMNEGHSAFLAIERIRQLVNESGLTFAEAKEVVCAGCVFTTHTSVPAGIDLFAPNLIDKYLGSYYDALGISRSDFLALGRLNSSNQDEPLNMAILALRLAAQSNAVSRLHGRVSRRLWQNIWPGVPEWEVPIISINNGIHTRSWISQDMASLFDRYLGLNWRERPADQTIWEAVEEIPDEELWRLHERRRVRLVAFTRRRLRAQLEERGASPAEVARAAEVLNPEAFTIGFARRMAVYKRPTLLLRHPERLARILGDQERPVQVIFAGKAHPQDNPAKELIRQLIHLTRRNGLTNVVFIEDYDLNVARYLLQGVDLWLNNPRLMQEASGTSGMKAAANGVLNLSVLDGWWAEAYQPDIGWAIGRGEVYQDLDYQDEVESNAIYDLLEKEIVPLFYTRGPDGLPRDWIRRMKNAMRTIIPKYNTNRMAMEYMEQLYQPADSRYQRLTADKFARARRLAEWKAYVVQHWPEIRIVGIETDASDEIAVGTELEVRTSVNLSHLTPDDVSVELYEGALNMDQEIGEGQAIPMSYVGMEKGLSLFAAKVQFRSSGRRGYTVRVLPRHGDLSNPFELRLITWGA